MTMTHQEAQATLCVLEKLIKVAEGLGGESERQRAALDALRGRRTNLRRIVAVRDALKKQPVVCLSTWRDPARITVAAL
ncbi:MAG TPA: hypothetical protein VL993_11745 [Stellaceae bacterium]|nr:hypothetical protein [Stellaceae bacterium]